MKTILHVGPTMMLLHFFIGVIDSSFRKSTSSCGNQLSHIHNDDLPYVVCKSSLNFTETNNKNEIIKQQQ